jgi:acyl carrier protein
MTDREKLINIFAEITGTDVPEINDNLKRSECEGWDSFNHLLIISEIESTFGKSIKSSDVEKINSFKDLAEIYGMS